MSDGITTIDISKMDKAWVLMRLFNAAAPKGNSNLAYSPTQMTLEQAEEVVRLMRQNRRLLSFDYVRGRVLKIDIEYDELDARLYDRDNGEGQAAIALGVAEL
jgi:hypothetical protein